MVDIVVTLICHIIRVSIEEKIPAVLIFLAIWEFHQNFLFWLIKFEILNYLLILSCCDKLKLFRLRRVITLWVIHLLVKLFITTLLWALNKNLLLSLTLVATYWSLLVLNVTLNFVHLFFMILFLSLSLD